VRIEHLLITGQRAHSLKPQQVSALHEHFLFRLGGARTEKVPASITVKTEAKASTTSFSSLVGMMAAVEPRSSTNKNQRCQIIS